MGTALTLRRRGAKTAAQGALCRIERAARRMQRPMPSPFSSGLQVTASAGAARDAVLGPPFLMRFVSSVTWL